MTFDDLLKKQYDEDEYNCAHFYCDAYEVFTGQRIDPHFLGLLRPSGERSATMALRREFKRVAAPSDHCLALLLRHRTPPHVGFCLDRRILHITESGVEFQPVQVVALGYETVRYYKL